MEKEITQAYKSALALSETMRFVYTGDSNKIGQYASFKIFAEKYNKILLQVAHHLNSDLLDQYRNDLPSAWNLTWPQQKEIFDGILLNLTLLISLLEQRLDVKQNKILDLKNFFQSNIRKAILTEPTKEKDIQDTIETLLIGKGLTKGIDYDRESGRVKVSIKEVIPDFILPKIDLAVEIKFTKDISKTKSIIDQINADIISYSKFYSNLLFIVYDFSTIRNEDEFKNDISNDNNIFVIVVKH